MHLNFFLPCRLPPASASQTLDHKEGWAPKNWCFWIVVLEKTLESPLDCKEIKPVNPKGNQPWIFIGRTDAKAEAPILWPPDAKNWLLGKDLDAEKDWGQEEKRITEDEMIGYHHHRLNGHKFEQTLGDIGGETSLACCSLQSLKESDTTYGLNNNKHIFCFREFIGIFLWPSIWQGTSF